MATDHALELRTIKHAIHATDADLSGSIFANVKLAGASFTNVNLAAATIHDANLSGVRIVDANLSGASIVDSLLDGMTINGIAVSELLDAYQAASEKDGSHSTGR